VLVTKKKEKKIEGRKNRREKNRRKKMCPEWAFLGPSGADDQHTTVHPTWQLYLQRFCITI